MLPLDPGQGLVPLKDGPQDGDSSRQLPSVIAAGELRGEEEPTREGGAAEGEGGGDTEEMGQQGEMVGAVG